MSQTSGQLSSSPPTTFNYRAPTSRSFPAELNAQPEALKRTCVRMNVTFSSQHEFRDRCDVHCLENQWSYWYQNIHGARTGLFSLIVTFAPRNQKRLIIPFTFTHISEKNLSENRRANEMKESFRRGATDTRNLLLSS